MPSPVKNLPEAFRLARPPRRRAWLWIALGAAVDGVLFALDLAWGDSLALTVSFLLGPLLASIGAGAGGTLLLGLLAITLAVGVGEENGILGEADHLLRIAILAVGSGLAALAAQGRDRALDTERRLGDSFALLDTVFESAPVGLALFDRELRFRRVNERLAEFTGVPAAAHIGRRREDVLERVPPGTEDVLERVLASGRTVENAEVSVPARDGRERHFLASWFPVRDGRGAVIGVGTVLRDISSRRAAEQALAGQTTLYRSLLEAQSDVGELYLVLAGERVRYANPAFESLSGYSLAELEAMDSIFSLVVAEEREAARRRARPEVARELVAPGNALTLRTRGGELAALEVAAVPMEVDQESLLVVVARDVSARRAAEGERQASAARMSLLSEASAAFDASLDQTQVAASIVRLLTRELADSCVVALGDESGRISSGVSGARASEREVAHRRLLERFPPQECDTDDVLRRVLRSGQTESPPAPTAEQLPQSALDAEHERLRLELGLQDSLVVALRARGRTLGAMELGFAEPLGEGGPALISLLEEVGRRAGLALDNARLYTERDHQARVLQRSLLPAELPSIPGLEVAARYRPAGAGNEVGGDFYDGFQSRDGWTLVIGDVCGKGAEAAAVTALARYTLRAAALHDLLPDEALRELNEAMLGQELAGRFCTALLAQVQPHAGGVRVCLSSGGHPLPLLLRADGGVEAVGRAGTLLGIVPDPDLAQEAHELTAGDTLVLFTDGVIEARPSDDSFGTEGLARLLGRCAGSSAAVCADRIERAVVEMQAGELRDDVAILVMRVPVAGEPPFAAPRAGVGASA